MIVGTGLGELRGAVGDGIVRFLGVPYAEPPVGENRFAAPVPRKPWQGVRDATTTGATAPQRIRNFPGLDIVPLVGTGHMPGDDFLTLNIWAPIDLGTPKPVMVFIHGGAWVLGSKDCAVHDGGAFARSGVVCVAINYRLGIDGFLPIPGCPTNLGLRDMIAALEWVRDHIASFGGDPANITLSGESAGALSVGPLVTSPLAEGLFARAIIQSGHAAMTRSIPVMQRLVAAMAKELGVAPTLEGFRCARHEATFDAMDKVQAPTYRLDLRDATGHEPAYGLSRFLPVHGDDVLPVPPLDALKAGAGRNVKVLIGSNAEEMNLYFVPTGVRKKLNRILATIILGRFQPQASKVLKAYGMRWFGKPGHVFTRALSDLVFRWPARRFAEEHQGETHVYDFSWGSPAFEGQLGACHGIELPFVFNTLATTTGPEGFTGTAPPQALADKVHRLWVDFARDGSLPWQPFDRTGRQVYDPATQTAAREPPMPAAPFLP